MVEITRTRGIIRGIFETTAGQWVIILSLIFGGCCSNAWTLEVATSQNPNAGSLITFAQFLLVTLFGLRKRFISKPPRASDASSQGKPKSKPSFITNLTHLRFKPLAVPISRWLVQVVLFYLISLLNNIAFKYKVPMAVHIVFRSGGLCVNMLLGYLFDGRKYTALQVISVALVSIGIATATSAVSSKPPTSEPDFSTTGILTGTGPPTRLEYLTGISLLTLALVFSTLLGFSQERTYAKYGRGHWQEGMFFIHALALPMFVFVKNDLVDQINVANSSPLVDVGIQPLVTFISLPQPVPGAGGWGNQPGIGFGGGVPILPYISSLFTTILNTIPPPLLKIIKKPALKLSTSLLSTLLSLPTFRIPSFWVPLTLNILTQLVCVNGVNRLTARVSSLSVTLVLTLRKAVSVVISVVLIGRGTGSVELWGGCLAVLIGTVVYTAATEATRNDVRGKGEAKAAGNEEAVQKKDKDL